MACIFVSVVACILVGIVVGFSFLERYVKKTSVVSEQTIRLELVDVPAWVNSQLKEKVYVAARGDGNDLSLVQQNIEREVVWLDEVTVQTTHDVLRIEGRWRKPVGLIKSGMSRFYVDAEQVVLDFVEMPRLPIVEITGLSPRRKTPPLGKVREGDDLAAAITILDRLDRMDKSDTPDKPLLYEIDRIDISNFNGRKNSKRPHIVLYAKDDTEIIWGAEVGFWQQHLESTDEQKLAKLYSYYKENGTLSGDAKYINLCDPQDDIPLPIDKY
ncbi:MAG: hypothetical protein IIC00_05595 [Planctomycetes bacterium]|nr:hypothetical protein [Planctomycetota bacterium]